MPRGLGEGKHLHGGVSETGPRITVNAAPPGAARKDARAMVKDPVCGMDCDPKTSDKVEYRGKTYYFCNPDCKQQFEKNPGKYIQAEVGGYRGKGPGEMGRGS